MPTLGDVPPVSPGLIAALVVLITASLPSSVAHSATFRVGDDAACTHATVQAAVTAAQSALEPSVIRISRSGSYLQQAVVVDATRNLELAGGYADCAQASADGGMTVLDGAGGATASVLRVITGTGATVVVRQLQIQNGDVAGAGAGGGIFFGGNGTLEVHDSSVINNIAGNGGGIYAGGAVPGARLIIGANVAISGNEARLSGGGVFVDGLEMTMFAPGSIIAHNRAVGTSNTGYGGGLFIRSLDSRPGLANVGSGGRNELGTIFGNVARVGGGVAVIGGNDLDTQARFSMFTLDFFRRATIRGNSATVAGGGLFVEKRGDALAQAALWNADIDFNIAPSGAAIYLTKNGSGFDGSGTLTFTALSRPEDASPCGGTLPCGSISGNISELPNGQSTDGATIQIQPGGIAFFGSVRGGVELRDNVGGRVIDLQPGGIVVLINSQIVDNDVGVHLIRAQQGSVDIADSTIAGNSVGSGDVLAFNADLELRRSILWQPGMASLSRSGGTLAVSSVIASEPASLGGAPLAIAAHPRFVDPVNGDYRLRAASPAVDFAPIIAGDDSDILNKPRDVDLSLNLDTEGPRDIGAFERQSLAPLVLNDEFNTNLNTWQVVASGSTTWDGSENGPGFTDSGSAKIGATVPTGGRVTGAQQCIHLPMPGRYLLNGYGMSSFAPVLHRDHVILNWQLRHDGNEQCEGPVDASADHLLTRGTVWFRPEMPAVIDVPDQVWTRNSSITVSLVVVDGGISVAGNATGWFDRITLTRETLPPDPPEAIFADGFE